MNRLINKYRNWRLKQHVKKFGSKNNGYFNYFNKEWFLRNQKSLLFLCNHWLLKYWFRWILRIHNDLKSTEKIDQLLPNTYRVKISENKYRSDFRTHQKFSKRIYYAFCPLWWTAHFIDWLLLDRFELLPSFQFSTLTVYPDAYPETDTVDGITIKTNPGVGYTWSDIHDLSGDSANPSIATDYAVFLRAYTNTKWETCYRGIFLFKTSSLSALATITDTTLSLNKAYSANQLGGAGRCCVVSSNPASNTNLTFADYSSLGTTDFCNITYSTIGSSSGYIGLTLNASGISNINKTSISKFGLRDNWDRANSFTGTYNSSEYVGWGVNLADYAGTSQDPKLVVTYTAVNYILCAGSSDAVSTCSGSLSITKKIIGSSVVVLNVPNSELKKDKYIQTLMSASSSVDGSLKNTQKILGTSTSIVNIMDSSLIVNRKLNGEIAILSYGELSLRASKLIIGISPGQSNAQALLSITKKIIGAADNSISINGSVKVNRNITGNVAAQLTTDVLLRSTKNISGSLAVQTAVNGRLSAYTNHRGSIGISSFVDAILRADKKCVAIVAAVSINTGLAKCEKKCIGDAGIQSSLIGQLTKYVDLNGTIACQSNAQLNLVVNYGMKGNVDVISAAVSTMAVERKLIAIINGICSTEGLLKSFFDLSGLISAVSNCEGDLSKNLIPLIGTVTAQSLVSCDLKADKKIITSIDCSSNISGGLTPNKKLIGEVNAVINTTAIIKAEKKLSTIISSSLQTELYLRSTKPVTGISNAICSLEGILRADDFLNGSVDSQSIIEGIIKANKKMISVVNSQSEVATALTFYKSLSAQVSSQSEVTGKFTSYARLTGSVNSNSLLTGNMSVEKKLAAEINSVSSIQSVIRAEKKLSASIIAATTMQSNCIVEHKLNGSINAQSDCNGFFRSIQGLMGSSLSHSELTAIATRFVRNGGSVAIQSDAAALMRFTLRFEGMSNIQSDGSADLHLDIKVAGSCNSFSQVDSIVEGIKLMRGRVDAVCITDGQLGKYVPLNGSVNAMADAEAVMVKRMGAETFVGRFNT